MCRESHGGFPTIQLADHASHRYRNPVSASDVQLKIEWAGNKFNKPRALSVPEIKEMVKLWGETAYLCQQSGFDGVQVHCAHGYLLAQFLSLTTNKVGSVSSPINPSD